MPPRRKPYAPTIHHHHHHHHHHHTTTKTYINGSVSLFLLPTAECRSLGHPPKLVTLHITSYTSRNDLPASLRLHVPVPQHTCSVAALARCIDAAWAHPRVIDWTRMIASCGVSVQGRSVKTDRDVVEWMQFGEEEEEAWLCG